jgi:PAS domain S-box-containing protein
MLDHDAHETEPIDLERLMLVIRRVHHERMALAAVVRLAGVGYWEWDVARDRVSASEGLCRLFGAGSGDLEGRSAELISRVHPDDRAAVEGMMRGALADHRPFSHDHRIILHDGAVRMLRVRGEVLTNDEGRAALLRAACFDVTAEWSSHSDLDGRVEAAIVDREELLYVAAHELRAPLTSLRLAIELLRRSQPAGSAAARQLSIIDRDEKRLSRLIDELLDLGHIRSGQVVLELAPVDLGDVVREVVARLTPDIVASGSPVTVDAAGPVVGRWDRGRLEQIVTNLLTNALKFGEQRPVEIRVATDDKRARLSVVDQGLGIAREIQRRIFLPFERADEAKKYRGLGLGLHVVRTLVERFAGDVRVDSEPGHGATFTVELPLEGPPS